MLRIVPREYSIAAFILYSTLGASLLEEGAKGLLYGVPLTLLAWSLVDPLLDSLRARRYARAASVLVALTAPAALLASMHCECGYLAAAALMTLTASLLTIRAPTSPYTIIIGAIASLSPGYVAAAVTPGSCRATLLYLYMLTVYVASATLYVQTLMPHRSTPRWAPLAALVPAYAAAVSTPYMLVALVEPTVRYAINTLRSVKVKPSGVRRLGWMEAARLTLFTILALSASVTIGC